MLDELMQFIYKLLKPEEKKCSLINSYYNGEVRVYKMGQIVVVQVTNVRKNVKPNGESIAQIPAEFRPKETIVVDSTYTPNDGLCYSCNLTITNSGDVIPTGFFHIPNYGINGIAFYRLGGQ